MSDILVKLIPSLKVKLSKVLVSRSATKMMNFANQYIMSLGLSVAQQTKNSNSNLTVRSIGLVSITIGLQEIMGMGRFQFLRASIG